MTTSPAPVAPPVRRRRRLDGLVTGAKRLVKSTVSPVLDAAGLFDRPIARRVDDALTIVLYHRIVTRPDRGLLSDGMCVTAARFEAQVAWFRRAFQPIRLDVAMARLARGEPLPPRALAVTFDDGYRDTLELAWPVLERQGVPATLFVPTGGLDDGEPFWWDRLAAAFGVTTRTTFDPGEAGLSGWGERPVTIGRFGREALARDVAERVWELPPTRVHAAVAALERQLLGRDGAARAAATTPARMTAAEVRAIHRHGVEIAAHSVRHGNLRRLSPAGIVAEVQESRTSLEALCDAPVRGFAYPAGRLDDAVVRTVAACAGIDYAVTTEPGVNHPGSPAHALRRVGMPDDPIGDAKRAFLGALRRGAAEATSATVSVTAVEDLAATTAPPR
jgi:peptidoglycan/xylan/chitin deacetylase (PgdA/CDA1 family)